MDFLPYKIVGILSHPFYRFLPRCYFWFYGFYKRHTDALKIALLPEILSLGQQAIDIGAHTGFYTRLMSCLVGATGKVYAFEPDSRNARNFLRLTRDLSNIEFVQAAVASKSGKMDLYVSRTLNVDHRTYQSDDSVRRRQVSVDAVSLDDFFAGRPIKEALIKMDIQGFEERALSGMTAVLTRSRPVMLLEFWPHGLRLAGGSDASFLNTLRQLDYQVFLVDDKHNRLFPIDLKSLKTGSADYYDILCWPGEKVLPEGVRKFFK